MVLGAGLHVVNGPLLTTAADAPTRFPRKLRGQRVLVTGASGFVGTSVGRYLAEVGAEVHGLSRSESPDTGLPIQWQPADLGDPDATLTALRAIEPEVIMHLAGHVHGTPNPQAIAPTIRSNLLGTVNLLTAAHEIGVRRVVVTGTMMEPDFAMAGGVPNSPYAASKWAGSVYARMFHVLYDLPVVNLRLFMVYGPGDDDARKLIPSVIRGLMQSEAPAVSSGRWNVDWVYIEDVAEAYACAALADGVEGGTFDIGSGQLHSIRRVVESLTGLVGSGTRPRFGALPDRPNEIVRVADTATSREALGWEPRISLSEGLRRTVDWHRQQLESVPLSGPARSGPSR